MRSLSYSLAAFFIALSCTAKQSEPVGDESYFIAYNTFEPDSLAKDNWEIHLLSLDSAPASKNLTKHPDVAWTYLAHRDKIYFILDYAIGFISESKSG